MEIKDSTNSNLSQLCWSSDKILIEYDDYVSTPHHLALVISISRILT